MRGYNGRHRRIPQQFLAAAAASSADSSHTQIELPGRGIIQAAWSKRVGRACSNGKRRGLDVSRGRACGQGSKGRLAARPGRMSTGSITSRAASAAGRARQREVRRPDARMPIRAAIKHAPASLTNPKRMLWQGAVTSGPLRLAGRLSHRNPRSSLQSPAPDARQDRLAQGAEPREPPHHLERLRFPGRHAPFVPLSLPATAGDRAVVLDGFGAEARGHGHLATWRLEPEGECGRVHRRVAPFHPDDCAAP